MQGNSSTAPLVDGNTNGFSNFKLREFTVHDRIGGRIPLVHTLLVPKSSGTREPTTGEMQSGVSTRRYTQ